MRNFGIEIEFEGKDYLLESALNKAKIPCKIVINNIRRTTKEYWKIVTDATVAYGHELVSPPISLKDTEQIQIVCDTLERIEATVNHTCGFHVHVAVDDFTPDNLIQLSENMYRGQTVISRFVSKNRRVNDQCRQWTESKHENFASVARKNMKNWDKSHKYYSLNFVPFVGLGTVEFRQHQGTITYEKMIQWINLCLAMVDKAKVGRINSYNVADLGAVTKFCKELDLDNEYFAERYRILGV